MRVSRALHSTATPNGERVKLFGALLVIKTHRIVSPHTGSPCSSLNMALQSSPRYRDNEQAYIVRYDLSAMATLFSGAIRYSLCWQRQSTRIATAQFRTINRRPYSRVKVFEEGSTELPQELQNLSLNEEGLLVDEKTGEVINEYGASRFDVAVRAIRGDFDPPTNVPNTERTPGLLLDSLMTFPGQYVFNVVLKTGAGDAAPPEQVLQEVAAVVARVCEAEVQAEQCTAKQRMGGKFLSLAVPAMVRAPEVIHRVLEELGRDSRVIMKY